MFFSGHHEDRFEIRIEFAVHIGHLEFVFEVGDGAQAANHGAGVLAAHIIDEEAIKGVDFDARLALKGLDEEGLSLFQCKERCFARVVGHGHDHGVEDAQGAVNDGQMAVGRRIKGAGVDGDVAFHGGLWGKRLVGEG